MDAIVTQIISSFESGQWLLGAVAVISLLTWIFNSKITKDAIPSDWRPWIAAVLGVLLAVFTALSVGIPWWKAIVAGLFTGVAAGGLWSLVLKHVETLLSAKAKDKKQVKALISKAIAGGHLKVDARARTLKIPEWAKDKPVE